MKLEVRKLFLEIYNAKDEIELLIVIKKYPEIFKDENWKPLGNTKSNYGTVKNQQSSPIASLIEKVTNSIDALLTKRCIENNIDPESNVAPKSMNEAIERFYPNNNWDLNSIRKKQAEEIQIIADGNGPRANKNFPTSVIIYDNGEGQHPQNFEGTFLSLHKGNKNKIQFVQEKYNIGGSGSIVFCGKKRYQLIASKRFDNTGQFGFTLIREHQKKKSDQAKETWYEYLIVENKILSFDIDKLDLGLENRNFKTGTIIKMYSYQFPKGYSGFAQDLNQSINEFLFDPALPILTKDTELRYPNNKVLVTDLYGLKRRLHKEEREYIFEKFSETYEDDLFGEMKVSCFVFKSKVKDWDIKKTREEVKKRYFKNGMHVMFSMNGQVHGHYSTEFISKSLKMNLLKNHLLIPVDCTEMKYEFRKELFMASRDRLKNGEETQQLRRYLAKHLGKKGGRLDQIQKLRKQATNVDTSATTKELLKNFTKSLPINEDIMKLLGDSFKLDLKKSKPKEQDKSNRQNKKKKDQIPFSGKRFPSQFKMNSTLSGDTDALKIPLNGEKNIQFNTDCDDDYFDRTEEPGELKIGILSIKNNEAEGGNDIGEPKDISELFNVNKSSPNKGKIKLSLNPKNDLKVGDAVKVKVSLTAPGEEFNEIFWVKVEESKKHKIDKPKKDADNEPLGLPQLIFAYQKSEELPEDSVSWNDVENSTGLELKHKTVMVSEVEGDTLKKIFVNMDSNVLLNFRGKQKNPNEEQLEVSNRKYYTAVYFHTLFLYTITKNRGYQIKQVDKDKPELEDVDLGTYLKDLFDHYYATFILSFGGMEEILQGLGD